MSTVVKKDAKKSSPIYKWMKEDDHWVGFVNQGVRLLELHRRYRMEGGGWMIYCLFPSVRKLFSKSGLFARQDSSVVEAKQRAAKFVVSLPRQLRREIRELTKELNELEAIKRYTLGDKT